MACRWIARQRSVRRTTRSRITDTTPYPYRATGRWTGIQCTGAFIGPHTILTAGHCLYDRPSGTWIAQGSFIPGANDIGQTQPWGVWPYVTRYVPSAFATQGTYNSGIDWDFAVLDIQLPAGYSGNPGWYGTEESLEGLTIVGYPGDKGALQQWTKSGVVVGTSGQRYNTYASAVQGDSGAAYRNGNNLTGVFIATTASYNIVRKWDSTTYSFVRDFSTAW